MRKGHSLKDIGDYTLEQFELFLNAEMQLEASERSAFVTDLSVVVGSLFGDGKGESPAVTHLDLLTNTAVGVRNGR